MQINGYGPSTSFRDMAPIGPAHLSSEMLVGVEGHERKEIRTRWWDPSLTTFRRAYIGCPADNIPDLLIPDQPFPKFPDWPTFIGHYWLEPHSPLEPLADRVACVDFSVAHRGPLVAYRFDGERELSARKFVSV